MVERARRRKANGGGDYFPVLNKDYEFIPTGCTLLDCVLNGGWVLGRISNIIGDSSVGKTLLAIEACANFAAQYPKGRMFYREAEAAFDESYASTVGLPLKMVDFGADGLDTLWDTIEDVAVDLNKQLDACIKARCPGLYIIDSLDALSTRPELKREIDEGTYATEKAKLASLLLRTLSRKIKQARFHVMVISQIRDKIGVMYGEKTDRVGGKALKFYSTHILRLKPMGKLSSTYKGVKRVTDIKVEAYCTKNKVGSPFQECEFPIRFNFGVDDLTANLNFLKNTKTLRRVNVPEKGITQYVEDTERKGLKHYREVCARVAIQVQQVWKEIDKGFEPPLRKYAFLEGQVK